MCTLTHPEPRLQSSLGVGRELLQPHRVGSVVSLICRDSESAMQGKGTAAQLLEKNARPSLMSNAMRSARVDISACWHLA